MAPRVQQAEEDVAEARRLIERLILGEGSLAAAGGARGGRAGTGGAQGSASAGGGEAGTGEARGSAAAGEAGTGGARGSAASGSAASGSAALSRGENAPPNTPGPPSGLAGNGAISPPDAESSGAEGAAAVYGRLEALLAQRLAPAVARLRPQLAEKDPAKRVYGPATMKRIEAIVHNFDVLEELFESQCRERFEEASVELRRARLAAAAAARRASAAAAAEARAAAVAAGRAETQREEAARAAALARRAAEEQAAAEERRRNFARARDAEEKRRAEGRRAFAAAETAIRELGWRDACRRAVTEAAAAQPPEKRREALAPLGALIRSIRREPDAAYLRLFRLFNPSFWAEIFQCPAGPPALAALSFCMRPKKACAAFIARAKAALAELNPALVPDTDAFPPEELFLLCDVPAPLGPGVFAGGGDPGREAEWMARLEFLERLVRNGEAGGSEAGGGGGEAGTRSGYAGGGGAGEAGTRSGDAGGGGAGTSSGGAEGGAGGSAGCNTGCG